MRTINASRAKLYLDLDGCLADFDGAYDRIVGGRDKRPSEKNDEAFWKPILDTKDFWLKLDVMPGAWELVLEAWKATPHLAILTSPSEFDTKRAMEQKAIWVERLFAGIWKTAVPPVFFKQSRDKHDYACQNSILIDDWAPNIRRWAEAGGVAIHHQSMPGTIATLREVVCRQG